MLFARVRLPRMRELCYPAVNYRFPSWRNQFQLRRIYSGYSDTRLGNLLRVTTLKHPGIQLLE